MHTKRKLEKLRTYNSVEFCNQQFDGFCNEESIVRHMTCMYTPQQNMVVSRLNRSIMNKVRSMLSESGLGKRFWAKAVSTALYLINISHSSVLEFRVPDELWTSAMPSLSGLKRLRCVVYIHTGDGKLNPRAKQGVLGYPKGVKGFMVWLLDDQKCIISRNVVLREDRVFKGL